MIMKISILIPVYGVEKYIEKCARSVFEQSYEDLEIIFVDDCTEDRSIQIVIDLLESYPNRKQQVKIIKHPVNRGLAMARDTAVKVSTGDYIFHLDSDDYLESESINLLVAKLKENPQCDIVTGSYRCIYPTRTEIKITPECENVETVVKGMISRKYPYHIWNRLYKRALYDGLIIPQIDNGEDYVTTCRLFDRASKIAVIDDITYNYTLLNQSSFRKRAMSPKNISDLMQSSIFLKEYFKDKKQFQYSLDIGHLIGYSILIVTSGTVKNMENIKIPNSLSKLSFESTLGNSRLILNLHRFRLYRLIRVILYLQRIFQK